MRILAASSRKNDYAIKWSTKLYRNENKLDSKAIFSTTVTIDQAHNVINILNGALNRPQSRTQVRPTEIVVVVGHGSAAKQDAEPRVARAKAEVWAAIVETHLCASYRGEIILSACYTGSRALRGNWGWSTWGYDAIPGTSFIERFASALYQKNKSRRGLVIYGNLVAAASDNSLGFVDEEQIGDYSDPADYQLAQFYRTRLSQHGKDPIVNQSSFGGTVSQWIPSFLTKLTGIDDGWHLAPWSTRFACCKVGKEQEIQKSYKYEHFLPDEK